jgi:hypothetical protein
MQITSAQAALFEDPEAFFGAFDDEQREATAAFLALHIRHGQRGPRFGLAIPPTPKV